eukprot:1802660-Rhodomonas_salina.2
MVFLDGELVTDYGAKVAPLELSKVFAPAAHPIDVQRMCNGCATDVQPVCNRCATGVQPVCNRCGSRHVNMVETSLSRSQVSRVQLDQRAQSTWRAYRS